MFKKCFPASDAVGHVWVRKKMREEKRPLTRVTIKFFEGHYKIISVKFFSFRIDKIWRRQASMQKKQYSVCIKTQILAENWNEIDFMP